MSTASEDSESRCGTSGPVHEGHELGRTFRGRNLNHEKIPQGQRTDSEDYAETEKNCIKHPADLCIEVFAFGKESIPVRIAELTSGAHAIRYAAEKAIKENVKLRLGLPTKCQPEFFKDKIGLQSLMPTESEVVGYAECGRDLLEGIQITEMLNPCARGFKMLEITPLPVN
jgi:hypothetical protein